MPNEMPLRDWMRRIAVLDGLKSARQIAYQASQEDESLQKWFDQSEALYRRFVAHIGVDPEPVFDKHAYRARKIAEGDMTFKAAYEGEASSPKP